MNSTLAALHTGTITTMSERAPRQNKQRNAFQADKAATAKLSNRQRELLRAIYASEQFTLMAGTPETRSELKTKGIRVNAKSFTLDGSELEADKVRKSIRRLVNRGLLEHDGKQARFVRLTTQGRAEAARLEAADGLSEHQLQEQERQVKPAVRAWRRDLYMRLEAVKGKISAAHSALDAARGALDGVASPAAWYALQLLKVNHQHALLEQASVAERIEMLKANSSARLMPRTRGSIADRMREMFTEPVIRPNMAISYAPDFGLEEPEWRRHILAAILSVVAGVPFDPLHLTDEQWDDQALLLDDVRSAWELVARMEAKRRGWSSTPN